MTHHQPAPLQERSPNVRPLGKVRLSFAPHGKPIKLSKSKFLPRKTQNDTKVKVGKPGCNPGRAQRAGGQILKGITPDEISAINRIFGGNTTITGDVEMVQANARWYKGFWNKTASVVRDIAGRHLFNDGNKRTEQAVVNELMRRNKVSTGVSPEEMRKVIL